MNLDLVITQLRTYCTVLGGRVGGSADFDVGTEAVIAFTDPVTNRLTYPAAVVIPLDDETRDDDQAQSGALDQALTERIGVVVEFDATADRRGQGGVDQVQAMKYALFAAILNWNPSPGQSVRGLRYGGGRLLKLDRARLFWQFEFTLDVWLTDGDGFPISGDPLTDALGSFSGNPPATTPITFDALAVTTITGTGSLATDLQNNVTLTLATLGAGTMLPPGTLIFGAGVLAGLATMAPCASGIVGVSGEYHRANNGAGTIPNAVSPPYVMRVAPPSGPVIYDDTNANIGLPGSVAAGSSLYNSFTTDSTGLVDTVALLLSITGTANASAAIEIDLYDDNDLVPNNFLALIGAVTDTQLSTIPTLFSFIGLGLALAPNTRYWVAVFDDSSGGVVTAANWCFSAAGTVVASTVACEVPQGVVQHALATQPLTFLLPL